jgi:hypothetical protein
MIRAESRTRSAYVCRRMHAGRPGAERALVLAKRARGELSRWRPA